MGTLGKAIYTVGFWIRETGQAIDRLGCRLQGNYYFHEQRMSTLSSPISFQILGLQIVLIIDEKVFNYYTIPNLPENV